MRYLYFMFCILLAGACNNRSYKDTLFCELDKEIQDTLLFINQHCFEEGYDTIDLIDFSGNCKLSVKFLSSWVISKQIVDTVNKKSVSLPTNAPMPYIVHNNTIYYPYEYNLLVFGFKNKTKFRTIKMK